jgi:hypothetical protein
MEGARGPECSDLNVEIDITIKKVREWLARKANKSMQVFDHAVAKCVESGDYRHYFQWQTIL